MEGVWGKGSGKGNREYYGLHIVDFCDGIDLLFSIFDAGVEETGLDYISTYPPRSHGRWDGVRL